MNKFKKIIGTIIIAITLLVLLCVAVLFIISEINEPRNAMLIGVAISTATSVGVIMLSLMGMLYEIWGNNKSKEEHYYLIIGEFRYEREDGTKVNATIKSNTTIHGGKIEDFKTLKFVSDGILSEAKNKFIGEGETINNQGDFIIKSISYIGNGKKR